MSDSSLTNEQAKKLLHELSSNNAFRARFEEKPAAALVELGIPHETVIQLPAACLAPLRLKPTEEFAKAHADFKNADASTCLSMVPPQLRV
jgi:putative modified peptide